ncbi:DUF2911 domain-containing protein [Pontibacter chitinilyticus]|uniref:DUF2911 domain-containing protein n=1 Tax=Pontibacter chitinilyticus TaxID=2674989 RepID=UPI003219F7A1
MIKKSFTTLALTAALLLGGAGITLAQGIKMPASSPSSKVEQAVGLSTVTVDYSRPSMRGRQIFGDLVPYDKLWRTGANGSTDITFSDEVSIAGNKVPAGKYALYTIPGKDQWTVVLHKNTELWGDGGKDYKPEQDQLRFDVKPQQNSRKVETFTIDFANLTNNSADVELLWDNVVVPFTIQTDVDSKVMSQIQQQVVKGTSVTPDLYASAANYYFNTDKDLPQALTWIKKANEKDAKFYNLHTQAKIQAKMKNYKEAIKTAEQSMALAQKEGNQDYVALNQKAIADWKKMK